MSKMEQYDTRETCTQPTPSLSAMLVHRFGMRADTLTYSLGGMGCSAGLIALDLAHQLMRARPRRL